MSGNGLLPALHIVQMVRGLPRPSSDQTIKLWDAVSGKRLLTLSGHTDRVSTVAFSPDGRQLASAATDRTIKVWDAVTGQERFSIPELRGLPSNVSLSGIFRMARSWPLPARRVT